MQFLSSLLRYLRRRRLLVGAAVVVVFAAVNGIRGTKYTSMRLTSLDMGLQGLKTVTFDETSTNNTSSKGCFWYSDNLFHLMCAVLTDRPVQFHAVANRVPRMQRELFQYLGVKRCESAKEKAANSPGSGWEDLERYLDHVKMNLHLLQGRCNEETANNTASSLIAKTSPAPNASLKQKKCLHLARNFNRRLQNCSAPLEECDTIVFDDTLPFCPLWKAMQQYQTIISPHGFQLALPILAHAALDPTQPEKSLHIIEVRWPGYQDGSYEEMVRLFQSTRSNLYHTLIEGHTPGGKLNEKDGDCHKVKACRKAERQKDLYCSAAGQGQMAKAIAASFDDGRRRDLELKRHEPY